MGGDGGNFNGWLGGVMRLAPLAYWSSLATGSWESHCVAARCEATRLALGQRGVSPRPSAHPGAPEITTINNDCRSAGLRGRHKVTSLCLSGFRRRPGDSTPTPGWPWVV